jgi:hypothetical protein
MKESIEKALEELYPISHNSTNDYRGQADKAIAILKEALEQNDTRVLNSDGTLHNFTLKMEGKPFRCQCGCNVFHKPNKNKLTLYQCNACETQFEAY